MPCGEGGMNFLLLLLNNKFLCKHVTAQYCLYLGNVENLVNHFRNAFLRGQCTHNSRMMFLAYRK